MACLLGSLEDAWASLLPQQRPVNRVGRAHPDAAAGGERYPERFYQRGKSLPSSASFRGLPSLPSKTLPVMDWDPRASTIMINTNNITFPDPMVPKDIET